MDLNFLLGWPGVYLAIAAFIIISVFLGVRIVPQSEKHVVERFAGSPLAALGIPRGVGLEIEQARLDVPETIVAAIALADDPAGVHGAPGRWWGQ